MSKKLFFGVLKFPFQFIRRNSTAVSWQPTIGLEVHAQLSTKSKLFAPSPSSFACAPNTATTYHDVALPGTLPALNEQSVECALRTALALGCNINHHSTFDRKHYFYADLPAGYQITQYSNPIAKGGSLQYFVNKRYNTMQDQPIAKENSSKNQPISSQNSNSNQPINDSTIRRQNASSSDQSEIYEEKRTHIIQVQLEHDSGKSLHGGLEGKTLVDFNRAGVALLEIITAPELHSSQEAVSFVKELLMVLKNIGVCDGKMEEGSLRVDASVSVAKMGEELGVRTEVKNLNSIRSISRAIDYEIERQIKLVEHNKPVVNQTLYFDAQNNTTHALRDKEDVHDYRYLPEPNLPPLIIPPSLIRSIHHHLPILPHQLRHQLIANHGLSVHQAVVLVAHEDLLHTYTHVLQNKDLSSKKNKVANFLINHLQAAINLHGFSLVERGIPVESIEELLNMLYVKKNINLQIACQVLDELFTTTPPNTPPSKVVEHKHWHNITNEDFIKELCAKVLQENPKAIKEYKKGKSNMMNFFVGRVIKENAEMDGGMNKGRLDGKIVSGILKKMLDDLP